MRAKSKALRIQATVVTAPMAGMYLGAKVSCQSCLQCFLDVEDKKSELYAVTKLLLETHHPNARAYFAAEKNVPPPITPLQSGSSETLVETSKK